EGGDGQPAELERHEYVEVERARELVDARVHHARRQRPARVVDDDVDAAELGDGALDQLGDEAEVVDVARVHERPPAAGAHVFGHALEVVGPTGDDGDVGTGVGEGGGDGGT